MWVKVLPADPTKESYFTQLSEDKTQAWEQLRELVHGYTEVVRTQAIADEFGVDNRSVPRIIMVLNEEGQPRKLPINKKATKYYPNDYGIEIRGEAVLVGWEYYFDPEDGPQYDIASMPKKWKIIHDMETAAMEHDKDVEVLHDKLDELLLEATDPDIRIMYEEIREGRRWMV